MKLKLLQGKFRIFTNVFIATVACGLIKYGLHRLGWEPFSIPITPYFTTILTGTIFLLGFILAGVMTDYKKCEAIPGKMVTSLYSIWQEAEMLIKASGSPAAKNLQKKICRFIEVFKTDFLFKRQEETTFEALYSFSEDFAVMDKDVSPSFMGRLRTEQTAIKEQLITIKYIRDTSFLEAGYVIIKAILFGFSLMLILDKYEDFDSGVFFMCSCIFILWSIFSIILDMDDPFEYEEGKSKPDEVNFGMLYAFREKIHARMEK